MLKLEENENRSGLFNLKQAKTFYPTEEEFTDPWAYLNSVNAIIHEYGICVVQPPNSWDRECFKKHVNAAKFKFATKTQVLHKLVKRDAVRDFGFEDGGQFTLQEFQEMADSFELLWSRCKTNAEKEKEYWKIVENGEEWVQVHYGSDLDVREYGSGFPLNNNQPWKKTDQRKPNESAVRNKKVKFNPDDEMSNSGWNVNNLPRRTFLHHINEGVSGITRPMIYVGMLFSSFCWHTEDNYLHSINYLHTGKDKIWYAVPASYAKQFEETFRATFPHLVDKHKNLLYLLITQISPRVLLEAGIPVHTATQKEGQFIITAPRAYHAGYNSGFNVAESVNFALEEWLPHCREAVENYRFMRKSTFSYEMFVLKAATNPDNAEVARILKTELELILQAELLRREAIAPLGIAEVHEPKLEKPCSVCSYDCYISGVYCTHHQTYACLLHAKELCACQNVLKRVMIRVPIEELKRLVSSLGFFINIFISNPMLDHQLEHKKSTVAQST